MIAVILAGGSGTRFWPLSRQSRPKQLVRLFGERVMIAQTFERLARVVSAEHVYIICGPHLVEDVLAEIPEMSREQLIVEPLARNTAPAIMLASAVVQARHGQDVSVGIFPSDHYIGEPELFAQALRNASHIAGARGEIVTMGVTPTRPETGYGYILREQESDEWGASAVAAFVEKPDHSTALDYLMSGRYLWNAGMFFFTPKTLNTELALQMPELSKASARLVDAFGSPAYEDVLLAEFERADKISIDYGVMEGAQAVRVLPTTFPWSDVGHWAALDEVCEHDEHGNVIQAHCALHDVKDSIFYSTRPERRIAAVGLDGMVVVDTEHAVLVMPKSRAQDVRVIVDLIDESER